MTTPRLVNGPGVAGRSSSLYRRIVALISGLFLLLALIIATGVYLFVNKHEESFQQQRQVDAVNSGGALINSYMETGEIILAALASFGIDELQAQPQAVEEFFRANPVFMEVTFVDSHGKTLFSAARHRPMLGNQFTVRQSQWFRTAKQGDKYYSDVQTSPSDESYIILSLPFGNGMVAAAQLNMDGLWQKVATISFGRSGSIYVVNRQGRIIAHRDPRMVTANRSINDGQGLEAILSAGGNEYAGISTSLDNHRVRILSRKIATTGWIIIAELPLSEAQEMSHRALVAVPIGLLALLALTAMIFRHLLWNTVLKRLEELCRGARRLSQGDLAFRHQLPERGDELTQVMEVFNSMADDLEQRQQKQKEQAEKLAEAYGRSEEELTERKRAEAALTRLNEELEQRVRDRTKTLERLNADLTREIGERQLLEEKRQKLESQLQQAQKMEAIGTLAGGISHDFNNILGSIIGYGEMVRDDLPPSTRNDIEQVLAAGLRAKELVKQILAFSRQAASDKIFMQPASILKESLKLLRSSIPTTIAIRNDIVADCGVILADPTQFQQIVMNLCTNAYHAMENSGGTMMVSLHRREIPLEELQGEEDQLPGPYVVLTVRDTGVGIAPDVKERMFDPFFTTKEIGKGTGMGLAMIHGIVKIHGGFIRCHSVLGEGSTFEVFLPATEGEHVVSEASHESVAGGKEHLLLVDDEQVLLDMNAAMLRRLGYRVTEKADSLEALAAFTADPQGFDLVLSDQTMPGLTGEHLARRILALRPDMPILLCTGYSNLISEEKVKALGIRGLAMKPLAKRDVALLIREALGQPAEPQPQAEISTANGG
jgi:signal transduction histidine kinase/ActR/RegA family two-component response regulator/HAMP domain-containing protein